MTEPTLMEPVVKKPKFTALGDPIDGDMPPPRPVTWRTFALIASLLIVVPVGALGAARIFGKKPPETQSYDSTLDAAQEALDKRAWDSPAGANVKELTDKLLASSPGDHRVLSIRSQAAESIVSDGIKARSTGATAEALRLFRLAQELDPTLDSAKALIAELEPQNSATPSAAAPAPVPTPAASTPEAPPSAKATSSAATSGSSKPRSGKAGTPSSVAPRQSGDGGGIELPIPDLNPPPPTASSSKDGPFI